MSAYNNSYLDSTDKILSNEMLNNARSRLVNICLVTLLITGFMVLPLYIIRIIKLGWQLSAVNHFFILAVGTPIILFRKRFSLTVRSITLVGISLSSAYFSFVSFGIVGSGFFGMGIMGCTVAALALGRNIGFFALTVSAIFFLCVCHAVFSGHYPLIPFLQNYIATKEAWIQALSGFILPIFMLIMGINEMHRILGDFITTISNKTREIDQQNRFRAAMFDTTDAFVLITDKDGLITDINKACQLATGYSLDAIKGRHFAEIFYNPELCEQIKMRFVAAKEERYEEAWSNKNGVPHFVNWSMRPIKFDQGEISHWFISGVDMTEYRLLEKRFFQSQKMESIGKLAGGIAHDFNNMLTGIIGSAEMLRLMEHASEDAEEYINMILSTGNQASTLIRQLLNFSRMESVPTDLVDLCTVINDAIALLKRSIPSNINIVSSCESGKPLRINGETSQIVNTLLNLGINSKDAMPEGGTLTFTTKRKYLDKADLSSPESGIVPGYYVELNVIDTGKGIPKDIVDHIFEPFFTTKEKGKGTGLGLASVYGTVKRHKGFIKVYSEPDKGTRFSLYFPAAGESEDDGKVMPSIIYSIVPWKVLVIDDEPSIMNSTGALLKDFAHHVESASNGFDGLKILEREEGDFDLIILDWIMPVMGGKMMLERIREKYHSIYVIISSGFGIDKQLLADLSRDKKVFFLAKPYTHEELLELIAEIQNGNTQNA